MALPEHVLNETCGHGRARMDCDTDECNDYLSDLEDEAAEELAQRRASGELI